MATITKAIDAYMSPEFRAFALRWLGFDPQNHKTEKVTACSVDFDIGGLVTYTLERIAEGRNDLIEAAK